MKPRILLTFDYELYFGKNYLTENEVLFEPTKKLLDIAKKHNIKLVFFIDICSLFAYEKYDKLKYVNTFVEQVKQIKKLGHDVQMHLHPHWIDSVYDGKNDSWKHNYKNWSYSNLIDNLEIEKANEIFALAQDKFIEIVGEKPVAFRAGGYTVQPNEKELIDNLKKYEYKYDSSVVPLRKFVSDAQYFDYMKLPLLNYWKIDDTSFLNTGKSQIYEVPMFALEKKNMILAKYVFLKIINKFSTKTKFKKRGQGATLKADISQSDSFSFSFDMALKQDKKIIKLLVKEYIKKHSKNNDEVILNILSHPKAIFDESLEVFEWFIVYMKENYDCEFVGFKDLELKYEN